MKITIEYLRECCAVDEVTGVLTWKVRPLSHFETPSNMRVWNGRYAGAVIGTITKQGYVQCKLMKRLIMAHQICWALKHGRFSPMLDHIDGNRSNNAIGNLRECTRSQNAMNSSFTPNIIGLKGVRRVGSKFLAQIGVEGKKLHLGSFDTAEEAHTAYREAAVKHHREFANFGMGGASDEMNRAAFDSDYRKTVGGNPEHWVVETAWKTLVGAMWRQARASTPPSTEGALEGQAAGWQLVPKKPTPEMIEALRTGSRKDWPSDELCEIRYAAMIAAAPAMKEKTDVQGK